MSGVADVRFAQGKINGEPLQNLTAHATFSGSADNVDKLDASLSAGHIIGSGKFDTATRAFEFTGSGDHVQLDRLEALANRPNLPKLAGTASLKVSAKGSDFKAVSTYQIDFDADNNDLTIHCRAPGHLKLVGRTENRQLNVTFTTTGLLGARPQIV